MSDAALQAAMEGMIPIEQIVAELGQSCRDGSRTLSCDRALFPFVNRCLNLFEHQCEIVSAEGRMIHVTVAKKPKDTG